MDLSLSGRRAVVTGGSKGIGFAVARELVAEGAAVAICARNPDELQAAAGELIARGGTVHASVTDVTKPDQVEAFIAAAAETLGGIDILVNNAGAAHPGTFETLTDAAWQGDLDVKLFSQIRCTRAALPHLRASNAARVININAIYARYPDPAFFATTVNRAALRRGVFHSVPDLITKSRTTSPPTTTTLKPFLWTATAADISPKSPADASHSKRLTNDETHH